MVFIVLYIIYACFVSYSTQNENEPFYTITPCTMNNTRSVIVSNTSSHNVVTSQLNIPCHYCDEGSYLTYNHITNTLECTVCPVNTYSTGGSFRIDGSYREFTSDVVNTNFITNCHVISTVNNNNNNYNHLCSAYVIDKGNKYIQSGNPLNLEHNGQLYITQFSISVTIVTNGFISFRYKKDTAIENGKVNGLFRFFINYLQEINDSKVNDNQYHDVYFPLTKGKYSFMFQYLKHIHSSTSENLSLSFNYFEIKGIETASLQCTPCVNGTTHSIGANHCNRCAHNEIFNSTSFQCIQCPIDTTPSFDDDKCVPLPQCNDEHYYKQYSGICNKTSNQEEVKYRLYSDALCKETLTRPNITYEPCRTCPIGNYWQLISNDEYKCVNTPKRAYTNQTNAFTYLPCYHGIIKTIAYYYPDNDNNVYTKNISIKVNKGEIDVAYNVVNPSSQHNILIYLNTTKYVYDYNNNNTLRVTVPYGTTLLHITYTNVLIDNITVYGDINGGGVSCTLCETNELVVDSYNETVCKQCGSGYEYNRYNRKCDKCQDGYYKSTIGNNYFCKPCAPFTYSTPSKADCALYDVLTYPKHKQKYPLYRMINTMKHLCSMTDNLCFNNLYGPIHDTQTNLFFISFNKPSTFNSSDFTYRYYNVSYMEFPGYVYELIRDDKEDTNEKVVVNLGREIEYVKMVNEQQSKGIVIKYINGDNCNYTNESYVSYIYLNCMKFSDEFHFYTAPKLIKADKCTYYFEWSSDKICPICLSSDIGKLSMPCRNGERMVYYEDFGKKCNVYNITKGKEGVVDVDDVVLGNEMDMDVFEVYDIKRGNVSGVIGEYVYWKEANESCSMFEDYNGRVYYLLLIIPAMYLCFIVIGIYVYCKYKKISGDYMRLMEEPGNDTNDGGGRPKRVGVNDSDKNNDLGVIEIELGEMKQQQEQQSKENEIQNDNEIQLDKDD